MSKKLMSMAVRALCLVTLASAAVPTIVSAQEPDPAARGEKPPQAAARTATVCPNYEEVARSIPYPKAAERRDIDEGNVLVQATFLDGSQIEITALRASDPVFVEPAIQALRALKCETPAGQATRVRVPVKFILQ